MCDYSLMAVPNRLAVCGEELVCHKFHTGAKGFISSSEACRLTQSTVNLKDWLRNFWRLLRDQQEQCTAVCIPPGARLLVQGLPETLQRECDVQGDLQEVVFTQTAAEFRFRDAVRFNNGSEISLQKLTEGLRVKVLSMSSDDSALPHSSEDLSAWPETRHPVFGR